MKKTGMAAVILLLSAVMTVSVKADTDSREQDEEQSYWTDLSYEQKLQAEMYGALYATIDDDITVEIPGDPTPDDEEQKPQDRPIDEPEEEGSKDDQKPEEEVVHDGLEAVPVITHRPQRIPSNQQLYGIRKDGTDKLGTLYYRWEEQRSRLIVYPEMIEKAKAEKKNIVIRIYDEQSGRIRYRVKLLYKDIKDMEVETLKLSLLESCVHKEALYQAAGKQDIVYLLECRQKALPVPVYIGVGVPDNWDRRYGVYMYSLQGQELRYVRNDLVIDEEGVIEVRMEAGKDLVFSSSALMTDIKSMKGWLGVLRGEASAGKQRLAIGSAAFFACAFILGILMIILWRKKAGCIKIRKAEEGE